MTMHDGEEGSDDDEENDDDDEDGYDDDEDGYDDDEDGYEDDDDDDGDDDDDDGADDQDDGDGANNANDDIQRSPFGRAMITIHAMLTVQSRYGHDPVTLPARPRTCRCAFPNTATPDCSARLRAACA
eukprot:3940678-Rhodomonas_salina.1